jgi:hypothetical protein
MVRKNIRKSPGLRSLPSLKEYSKDPQDLLSLATRIFTWPRIIRYLILGIGIFRTLQGNGMLHTGGYLTLGYGIFHALPDRVKRENRGLRICHSGVECPLALQKGLRGIPIWNVVWHFKTIHKGPMAFRHRMLDDISSPYGKVPWRFSQSG